MPTYRCDMCGGTGLRRGLVKTRPCPRCNGTGRVTT